MSTDFLFQLWSLELFKDINVCSVCVLFSVTVSVLYSVILSPRGQAGIEAKILSSSASKNCPRPRTRAFVLGTSSNFLFWPRENECNDGTGNHYEFAMIIYQSYLLTNLVLLI